MEAMKSTITIEIDLDDLTSRKLTKTDLETLEKARLHVRRAIDGGDITSPWASPQEVLALRLFEESLSE